MKYLPIYKVTYSPVFKRANVHNYGCNFKCKGCSYKLKNENKKQNIPIERVKRNLKRLYIEKNLNRVNFLGGEPTINPDLTSLVKFVRRELKSKAYLGHTNGSNIPPDGIDGMTISLKAYTDRIHIDYTGKSNSSIFENFIKSYEEGIEISASSTFIPGYIAYDEIDKIAEFISGINYRIPYHVIGYIPVPNSPWRKPTSDEIRKSVDIAKDHLENVTYSRISVNEFLDSKSRDLRYQSITVIP